MVEFPRIVLKEWPTPAHPRLDDLAVIGEERLDELRGRLPVLSGSAWAVAQALSAWVAAQWAHDGDNTAEDEDAAELLERAAAGERFRCVEYGIVLGQGLNAVGIPARQVHALRPGYDRPQPGMGHVVVEAWVDDLDKWVVIDGQNHAYWSDERGTPLSALELWRRFGAGETRPEFIEVGGEPADSAEADYWWQHFAAIGITPGAGLADERGFAVGFQGRFILHRTEILTDPSTCYPVLSTVNVGTTWTDDGRPGLRLTAVHPYATGLEVEEAEHPNPAVVPLDLRHGEHGLRVSVRTPHGSGRPNRIIYAVGPYPDEHRR